MRLRNIPGAKDAILECDWVIDEPEKFKGEWASVFGEKRPLFLEVGMGKGRFLMDMARRILRGILLELRCMTACCSGHAEEGGA